jgi:release factor glutamine methyltransferase
VSPKKWTIKELLEVTTDYLHNKHIDNPRLSADLLLAHQLKVDRVRLYLDFDQPLSEMDLDGYRALIKRRVKREPIQYIIGVQEFWSIPFQVTPKVLIPRPESEILVEQTIALFKAPHARLIETLIEPPKILDLGTGSGALALSIAKELENASVWASDISQDALDVAGFNAQMNHLEDRITFIQGDLWQPFINQCLLFDVILSNPPYIASEEYDSLAPEVRDYEPRIALDGLKNGMHYIEKIILGGAAYLRPGGWLLLEMDPAQMDPALALVHTVDELGEGRRIQDYGHHDRVLMVQRKEDVA